MRRPFLALIVRRGEGRNLVVQLIIMIVFFVLLAAGGIGAALVGRLPTTKELAEEDEERASRYKRALER
jgi:hypothetical protein